MLNVFTQLLGFLKLDSVWIDNNIFRLHYKATVIIFVGCSLLVTSRQYFGDPIDCIVDGVPGNIMDTYCWIHSTFTIPNRLVGKEGYDFPHPGLAPLDDLEPGTEVKYHKYYQWVAFFLFLEAAFFYMPRYLWKIAEGGKIKMLVQGLMEPMIKSEVKKDQINLIAKYFKLHRGTHSLYALKFFMCEFLNFANVIGQIYFIDFFLGYEFTNYGIRVLEFTEMEDSKRADPMNLIFPKVTKCTFHKYGPSGTIEVKDGLCVLPLNIINEKIFVLIWFWLVILAALTGVFLIYRLAVLVGPKLRVALIAFRGGKSTSRSYVETILDSPSLTYMEKIGDWLVLYLIVKNLDTLSVNEVIHHIYKSEIGTPSDTETLKLKSSKV